VIDIETGGSDGGASSFFLEQLDINKIISNKTRLPKYFFTFGYIFNMTGPPDAQEGNST
jgi:hypothetical protein